jgi:hypothetical protein
MNDLTKKRIEQSDQAARLERLKSPESVQNTKAYRAVGGEIHLAYCKTDAPASDKIACYLDMPYPAGIEVEVTCLICGGNLLNAAVPRLEAENQIYVIKNSDGNWQCLTLFQGIESCDCFTG